MTHQDDPKHLPKDSGRRPFLDDQGWTQHPLHPTRAVFDQGMLRIEQRVGKRFRFGPILSTAVMTWLQARTFWDGDDDGELWWSVAFTVMGDWPSSQRGMLQLVCGGDGRPGLRRGRKPSRIRHDLSCAWRGTRRAEPWLDIASTGVIPMVLHYMPLAEQHPELWGEVQAMAQAALMALPGRSAYQLARAMGLLPAPTGTCVYCGSPHDLTHDHANPLDSGGAPWGDNLVPACLPCNRDKSSLPLTQWLAQLPHPPHDLATLQAALATQDQSRPAPPPLVVPTAK